MKRFFLALLTAILTLTTLTAQETSPKISRILLVSGSHFNRVAIINQDGKELWVYPEKQEVNDSWYINDKKKNLKYVVMAYKKGVRAVIVNLNSKAKNNYKVLWNYKTPRGMEISSCQPLKNNKFLLGASSKVGSKLYELTPPNKIKEILTIPEKENGGSHYTFRQVRTDNTGLYYYGIFKRHSAYITDKKFKRTVKIPLKKVRHAPFTVVPKTENGKKFAYIGGGEDSCIIKVNSKGKVIWKIDDSNLKGGKLAFVAGINVLKNGNILVANWGQIINRNVSTIIEINPKTKTIVWELPKIKYKNAITSVQLISENGKEINNPIK